MPGPGKKVNDPHNEIEESTGPVAADALAAESNRAGGGFSENKDSEPLGVTGKNSTFANANTSGAKTLPPTKSGDVREDDKGATYPEGAGGQSKSLAVSNTEGSYETGGSTSNAGTAPGYVNSQQLGGKPKGKNLTEGGFEGGSGRNASYNTDIGGKNDPGRLAVEEIVRHNAPGESEAPGKREGIPGDNVYSELGRESSA